MTVFAGEKYRPARSTYGISHKGAIELDPFLGQAINIGGWDQLAAIGAYRVFGMVISHYEQDVGRGSSFRGWLWGFTEGEE